MVAERVIGKQGSDWRRFGQGLGRERERESRTEKGAGKGLFGAQNAV